MAVIGPAAIVSPMTKEQEEKKEKVGGVVEDVIEKDMVNIEYMKTNVNAKVVVGYLTKHNHRRQQRRTI
jgi:hypothetical protein